MDFLDGRRKSCGDGDHEMGQKKPLTTDQAATADYIVDMACQLAAMARAKGLDKHAAALDAYRAVFASRDRSRGGGALTGARR